MCARTPICWVERLRCLPNLEIGGGNDRTGMSANSEFVYTVRIVQSRWVLLGSGVGGGGCQS